jgi:hypothetical protein
MKESVKIDAALVEKVRKRIKKTKQTIGGFFEIAAKLELVLPDKQVQEWKEKAEKWDALDDEIGLVYIGQQESTLEDVGRFIVDKFGY